MLMIALLDGSVRSITAGANLSRWKGALQPADGLPFDATWEEDL
jgi:hypothetical protein